MYTLEFKYYIGMIPTLSLIYNWFLIIILRKNPIICILQKYIQIVF